MATYSDLPNEPNFLTSSVIFEVVLKHQISDSAINKAGYTATKVACGWAAAVMQKLPVNAEKS